MAEITNSPATSISDFIATVKGSGLARSNRFGVTVTVPPMLGSSNIVPLLYLFCESAQLPGMNMSTTQARTFGEYREMPYEKLYDTVNLTFLNDTEMRVKTFWESWIGNIQDPVTREFKYYNDYTSNIDIYVYDVNNNTTYQVTLYEAYPKTLASSELNQGSREVMKTTVTLQYRYYRSSAVSGGVGTLASQLAVDGNRDFFTSSFGEFQSEFNALAGEPIQALNAVEQLRGVGRVASRLKNQLGNFNLGNLFG